MSRFLPAASAAVLCTLLLGACTGSGNGTENSASLPTVSLVGERTGLMVWRPVAKATSYQFEILTADGRSEYLVSTTDTVGLLPPNFQAQPVKFWWIRALEGSRVVAASEKARIY